MVVNFSSIDKQRAKDTPRLYHSSSTTQYKMHSNSYNNTQNPLKGSRVTSTQPTFKGFSFNQIKELLTVPKTQTVRQVNEYLRQYIPRDANSGLNHNFDKLRELCDGEKSKDQMIICRKKIADSLKESVTDFPKWIGKTIKKVFGGQEVRDDFKRKKEIEEAKSSLAGYFNETKQHDDYFDNLFKITDLKESLKSEKNFQEALKKNKLNNFNEKAFIKACETHTGEKGLKSIEKALENSGSKDFKEKLKGDYITRTINAQEDKKFGGFIQKSSNDGVQLLNRTVSGSTTAWFVANDFHNLKISTTNDKKQADKQWNERFGQQTTRIGISAYLGYIVNATFSNISNKSLPIMLGLAAGGSVVADIITRIVTNVPLYPKMPKNVSKDPYVIKAAPLKGNMYSSSLKNNDSFSALNTYNSLNHSKNNAGSFNANARAYGKGSQALTFSGNPVKQTANFFSKNVSFEEFKKVYEALKHSETKDLQEKGASILKVAGKHTLNNDKASINDIEKAAKDGKIIIGKNAYYKFGHSLVETVKYPINLVAAAGLKIANLGRSLANKEKWDEKDFDAIALAGRKIANLGRKEPLTDKAEKFSDDAKKVLNYIKIYNEAKTVKKGAPLKPADHIKAFHNEIAKKSSSFHSPDVMDFPASDVSTYIKLTGFCTIPFLALDTHNTAIETTNNVNITKAKTKERVLQDTTRQGVSFWAVRSFNKIFEGLINHSLPGNALGTFLNVAGYEAVTRLGVGQPIFTKSHDEMKKIEKARYKKQNWFTKAMSGKIKMHEDSVVIGSTPIRPPAAMTLNEKFAFLGYNK